VSDKHSNAEGNAPRRRRRSQVQIADVHLRVEPAERVEQESDQFEGDLERLRERDGDDGRGGLSDADLARLADAVPNDEVDDLMERFLELDRQQPFDEVDDPDGT